MVELNEKDWQNFANIMENAYLTHKAEILFLQCVSVPDIRGQEFDVVYRDCGELKRTKIKWRNNNRHSYHKAFLIKKNDKWYKPIKSKAKQ